MFGPSRIGALRVVIMAGSWLCLITRFDALLVLCEFSGGLFFSWVGLARFM